MTGGATGRGAAARPATAAQPLRASRDVRAVFAERRAAASAAAVVHARSRADGGPPRVAVVCGKSVGNAVQRNRAKRRLREAARALKLRAGADYVVVGRVGAATMPWDDLQAILQRAASAVWARR